MNIKKDKLELLKDLGFEIRNWGYQKFIKNSFSIEIDSCREICFYMNGLDMFFPKQLEYIPTWAFLTLMKMYKLDMLED